MTKTDGRGRPSLTELSIKRVVFQATITLYEGADDDLIDWFNSIPTGKRASYIKMALRQGGASTEDNHQEFDEFISDDLLDDLLGAL